MPPRCAMPRRCMAHRMLDVVGGAQQDHFPAGSHQIAATMAAELGKRVRLNSAVTRIEWSDAAVAVMSSDGAEAARQYGYLHRRTD